MSEGPIVAFAVVLAIVHVGPMLLIWRSVRATETRDAAERELRVKDRILLAKLAEAMAVRAGRRPIGYRVDSAGHGDSTGLVVYEPAPSDDTRGTVR